MSPKCSICGAPAGKPHNDDLHRAFNAMKAGHASEPLSAARKAIRDPAGFRKVNDPWHDGKRRP